MGELYRVRATLAGWTGGPGLYTAYFDASAGISPSDAATVAGRVRGAWDVFKTSLATVQTLRVQPIIDVLDDESGELVGSVTVATPAIVTGTAATPLVGPSQVMAPLILDTGVIADGRKLRGRSNLGPVAASFTNNDLPPTALATNVNAFGVALATATPPSATAPLMVWRRPKKDPSGIIVRAGLSRPCIGATAGLKWFTLNSRRD